MTYCVGILLKDGIVLASDSRTHAGVDNFAKFCKMTVFERIGDRVLVLLSSGNLAGTQAVISVLKQRGDVAYPPLVTLAQESDYRAHFEQSYCAASIQTHDGIHVRFHP